MPRSLCAFFFLALTAGAWAAKSVVYPLPDGEQASTRFKVKVDGHDSGVYIAHVLCISVQGTPTTKEQREDGEASFTSFDLTGRAHVTVTSPDAITTAKLLPSNRPIPLRVHGHQVSFDLNAPGQYTVELNGDWNNSLHLFANAPETDIPRADDPNVLYFGPGVHRVDPIVVSSGKTVYIAPGAVIYGKEKQCAVVLRLEGDNITVRGRGIIDDSLTPRRPCGGEVMLAHGNHLKIEGVTLRDSAGWTLHLRDSQHVTIDNVKIFGWRENSDGIDINGSQDVEVSGGFIRTYDDLVVLKTTAKDGQPTRNVTVTKMVLWNAVAHALSLGAEIRQPIEDVLFGDCDVIHDKGREWTLRVYNTDAATVHHVVFSNIRVEETQRLTSVWIGKAKWSRDDERGHVDDIQFLNIRSVAGSRPVTQNEIVGADPEHAVSHVIYKDVVVDGKPLLPGDVVRNPFADHIEVIP